MNYPHPPDPIVYPDSDGKPMSDNTLQFRWIQVLTGNLAALFRDRDDVFVGGDLLWYPVQGFDKIRQAPDAFVVFGRPQGYRGSYQQWEEDNVPMTVVFEVRSPRDSDRLMRKKRKFYDEYGVEEYYLLDPQTNTLEVYLRRADQLAPQRLTGGHYTSPRLGIRFDLSGGTIAVFYPDGQPFLTFAELVEQRQREAARADQAEEQRQREAARADQAEEKRQREAARADQAEDRSRRLAELGRLARRGQATAEQLAELERLEDESSGA